MSQIARLHRGVALCCLAAAAALGGFAVFPLAALAQSAAGPATIRLTVPPEAQLGQDIPLQVRLTSAAGQPIAYATVYFTSPTSFLNVSGDAVIAEGVTDAQGVATASWRATRAGGLTIQAEFRGNTKYAAFKATTLLAITGEQQLYAQEAGVPIPGLNVAPNPGLGFFAALWPRLSAWPIAAALLVVWSIYATAATLLFRIAAAGARVPGPAEAKS